MGIYSSPSYGHRAVYLTYNFPLLPVGEDVEFVPLILLLSMQAARRCKKRLGRKEHLAS